MDTTQDEAAKLAELRQESERQAAIRTVQAADRLFAAIPEDLRPVAKIVERERGPIMVVPTRAGVPVELNVGAVDDTMIFSGRDPIADMTAILRGAVGPDGVVPVEGLSAPDRPEVDIKTMEEENGAASSIMPETVRRVFIFESGDPWFACFLANKPNEVIVVGQGQPQRFTSMEDARAAAREERGDFEDVTFQSFQILYKASVERDLAFIKEHLPGELLTIMRLEAQGLLSVLIFEDKARGAGPIFSRPSALREMILRGPEDAAEVFQRLLGDYFAAPAAVPASDDKEDA